MAITVNSTAITFNNGSIQTVAGTGTVSSVATGNGLSGGTITTTGTLVLAAPTFNSVGSYAFAVAVNTSGSPWSLVAGSNYAAGTGNGQINCCTVPITRGNGCFWANTASEKETAISGTWKWMAATNTNEGFSYMGIACRVS